MSKNKKFTKVIYILPILWAVVLRCSIGLYPQSGKEKPPLFGDFEAQRHWMEITVNLPVAEWYFNSTNNDLNYWGLDYPPLTAYHSYITGLVTQMINSSWTNLNESRGSENISLVALMRSFVLMADIIVFLPALSYFYIKSYPRLSNKMVDLNMILCGYFFPGIILIDHGHFQYNVVSLGLFIISSIHLINDNDIIASVFFCMALSYKQMELYHSLPIFCFLLGKCFKTGQFVKKFLQLSVTVLVSFSVLLIPFWINGEGWSNIRQILFRMFPVSRGIYEDKVSNFWCAISPIFKFTNYSSNEVLTICGMCTLLASIPACLSVMMNSRKKLKYLYASLVVSLAFFLFSFQVHEKSILIPAASALILIPFEPFWANFFLYTASLSMGPLLVKDQLVMGLIVCSGIFLLFFIKFFNSAKIIEKLLFIVFNLVYLVIVVMSLLFDPPVKLPFLYPLLISQWCCVTFLLQFIHFYMVIFSDSHR